MPSSSKRTSNLLADRYADIIKLSPIGFVILNAKGTILECNPAYYKISGYRRKELLGQHISLVAGPRTTRREIYANIQKILSGQQLIHTVSSRRKDGCMCHVRLNEKRIELADGTWGVLSVAEDITKQYEIETRLKESEERFRKMFVDNKAKILIVDPRDQRILDANKAACRYYGYAKKKMLTMHMGQINILSDARRKALMKEALKHSNTRFEFRHQLANGTVRDVEVYATPIQLSTGAILFVIIHDIHERKETEKQLEQRLKQQNILLNLSNSISRSDSLKKVYAYVLEALQDGLGIKSASILLLNPEKVMEFVTWFNLSNTYRRRVNGHSPWKPGALNPKPIYIKDVATNAYIKPYRSIMNDENIQAMAFIPLTHKRRLFGKFMVYYDHPHVFTDNDKAFIQTVANQLSIATIRHRDAERLKASEELHRSLIQASPDAIISLDTHAVIRYANQKAADIYGYKHSRSLIGKSGFDFIPDSKKEETKKLLADTLEKGHFQGVIYVVNRYKKIIPLETSAVLMHDSNGRPFQLVTISRDITEKLKAQEKLEESERLFRKVMEEAPDGMVMADSGGHYILVNEAMCRLTGYTREELTNMTLFDLLAPNQKITLFPKILNGGKGRRVATLISKDGAEIIVEITGYPIKMSGKQYVIGHVRDITQLVRAEEEKKKLEEQIRNAAKLESLGILAGGIAHDFNNLLTGILGNVGLSEIQLSATHPAMQNIKSIESSAMRAADLCRQLLAYSGKGRFLIMSVNINEIVEEIGTLLESSISHKAVIKYNLTENLPPIEVDTAQIQQVIMNLIINASDAIGKKSGIISIHTGMMECDKAYLSETYLDDNLSPGAYVFLEVSDTGCGMDEETLAKIFDPFFTTKFTGRGLGLAAVLGIIRGHNGTIKVYSEKNKGTTFKVLFPISEKAVQNFVSEEAPLEQWKTDGHILIVDDEESIRVLAAQTMKHVGMQPLTAANGQEAIKIYRRHKKKIRIVLMDMTMPKMDGLETFRELRRIHPDVKVVLSSGYNEQEATSHFVGKGLAGFLQKPYKPARLIKAVKSILEEEK
ncbi:MAG: PAS domain S-box protein [Calditrichaeota bacterium]|nr:MAG: PAS domain S-box protein [Calditrichota bacterium]